MSQAGIRWIAALTLTALLSGCFEDDTVDPSRVSSLAGGSQPISAPGGGTPPAPPPNGKPTITGTPVKNILQGESYSFRPLASDPDGDSLTFQVSNKPAWASFDSRTGRLYGTPGAGDVGSYSNIRISVTDGKDSAQLSAFTLTVEQIANGSATLSWTPPTENTDGSVLTNLAGYKIYYGRSSDSLSQVVTIDQAGVTTYVIENLSPAVYYFAMTSLNSEGVESERSATLKKTIG
jgi:hypothetical protein